MRRTGSEWTVNMRNAGWLRKNWPWVAGGAFLGIHIGTWAMQKAMKSSVHSQTQTKPRSTEDSQPKSEI
ncbi:hypothetical protein COCON_G00038980 [Conger conger]|uniref:Transmembrane protein n=1 Tax=Conger conger TaxID=82655 RepID=A0A9Q1E069_CONCO|nr:hypothetical protein COCON_G00038980 [Conger conger]